MMNQIYYYKAPTGAKYTGKSVMVKKESNGDYAIMTILKYADGHQSWNGIALSPKEKEALLTWLNQN